MPEELQKPVFDLLNDLCEVYHLISPEECAKLTERFKNQLSAAADLEAENDVIALWMKQLSDYHRLTC